MRAVSGGRSLKARINATEWREIQRVLAGYTGDVGILGPLAPLGLWADGALSPEALDLFRGFTERRGGVTARLRNRFELVTCHAWFSLSRAGTIMIDDGEGLTFQACQPGFFPIFLRSFLRIGPLPIAEIEGTAIGLETIEFATAGLETTEFATIEFTAAAQLLEEGSWESSEGGDERLADSLRAAAPKISHAVMDGDWRLWSVTAGKVRENQTRPGEAFIVLATPHGSLGILPSTKNGNAAAIVPLRSSAIWEVLTRMIAPTC